MSIIRGESNFILITNYYHHRPSPHWWQLEPASTNPFPEHHAPCALSTKVRDKQNQVISLLDLESTREHTEQDGDIGPLLCMLRSQRRSNESTPRVETQRSVRGFSHPHLLLLTTTTHTTHQIQQKTKLTHIWSMRYPHTSYCPTNVESWNHNEIFLRERENIRCSQISSLKCFKPWFY